MPRRPTGAVIEHVGRNGRTYRSLRFTAYGVRRRINLGMVGRERAEAELRCVLAAVEAGTWAEAPRALRFFERGADDECWLWTGPRSADGYGKSDGRRAHRIVYELLVGPVPSGLAVYHRCRVPLCVNPAHMELMTQAEVAHETGFQLANNG